MQGSDGKYMVLAFDEIKIKEDLIYNKHTGQIIGYVNLGDIEQQLVALEENRSFISNVATHMLQFMLRGLSARLNNPVAHFATSALTAKQLYPMVWDVIGSVECTRLKVIIITANGASMNRKFFRMHKHPSGSNVENGIVYKTTNMYAEDRNIYFMSDVPHLINTVRNCWEKSRFGGTILMQVCITSLQLTEDI